MSAGSGAAAAAVSHDYVGQKLCLQVLCHEILIYGERQLTTRGLGAASRQWQSSRTTDRCKQ